MKASLAELTIAFISYRSLELICRNHGEILQSGKFAIKIVENDTKADTSTMSGFSSVELIESDINLGYGRAANLLLDKVASRWMLLLNPDVKASQADIQALLKQVEALSPVPAIAAPASRENEHEPGSPPRNVQALSGCAMLLDVAAIRELGLFDENIFLYSEDAELCQRAAARNLRMTLIPGLYFPHEIGTSTPGGVDMEYMRWWHFGWSNCYRMTKHKSTTWWRNPHRKCWSWRLRSWVSLGARRRKKWQAKADGAKAFLKGEEAFSHDGKPRHTPSSAGLE